MFDNLLLHVHHYHLQIEGEEDPGAGGSGADSGAGGGADPVDPPASSPPKSSEETLGGAPSDPIVPADWPSDWREKIAGTDEKALRELKRYGGPDGLWKKIVNQEKTISDREKHRAPPTLPDNATDEQLADYRKAVGIPETPDGYGLKLTPEIGATEADMQVLKSLQEHAFSAHVPQQHLAAIGQWYQERMAAQIQEAQRQMQRAERLQKDALFHDYGPDKDRYLRATDEFLQRNGIMEILDAVLPNGMPLRYDSMFRRVINMAIQYAPEESLYGGDSMNGGSGSLDDQLNELSQKSIRGKLTEAESAKYDRLIAYQIRRSERNAA